MPAAVAVAFARARCHGPKAETPCKQCMHNTDRNRFAMLCPMRSERNHTVEPAK